MYIPQDRPRGNAKDTRMPKDQISEILLRNLWMLAALTDAKGNVVTQLSWPLRPYSYRTKIKGERGAICEEVIVSYKPTVRNVAVRNASNIKQCRSSKNQNDNNNNKHINKHISRLVLVSSFAVRRCFSLLLASSAGTKSHLSIYRFALCFEFIFSFTSSLATLCIIKSRKRSGQ